MTLNHALKWTQDEDVMLKRLVIDERKSFGVAAAELKRKFPESAVTFTRNACISRAHRLQLGGRTKQEDKWCNQPPGARSPDKRKNLPSPPSLPLIRLSRPAPSLISHDPSEYEPMLNARRAELVDGTCQFIGQTWREKCARPCDGQTNYCEYHRSLCYQPDPRRR